MFCEAETGFELLPRHSLVSAC